MANTPDWAPRANASANAEPDPHAVEVLDWMLITGERHLERVPSEYVDHYNLERLHRSGWGAPPAGEEAGQSRADVV